MDILINGFILMVITAVWKWLSNKVGVETGRFIVHGFLFGVSLIYASYQYWGNWPLLLQSMGQIWTLASGTYEVLVKTILPIIGGALSKVRTILIG